MKYYKVIFADLDNTVITTLTGKTFPEGIWDMKFRFDTLNSLKKLQPKCIHIVTNQGAIELNYFREDSFVNKLQYVASAISDYVGCVVTFAYCPTIDKKDYRRKPNPGMIESQFVYLVNIDKNEMLMIGDASGKEGDYSDSDKKCAENAGIDYLDVEEFNKQMVDYEN